MRRAQADVLGALMFMIIILASSFSIFYALSAYFAGQSEYSSLLAYLSAFSKQNVSVCFVQALPPSAESGIIAANYGEPIRIIYLVEEQPNGSLKLIPENLYLQHGQVAELFTEDQRSGVMTSYGGLFMANLSEPLIPVSLAAVNVSLNVEPQLLYVSPGYYTFSAQRSVKWFVNGSFVHSGMTLTVYINGPTSITAVPVSSSPQPMASGSG